MRFIIWLPVCFVLTFIAVAPAQAQMALQLPPHYANDTGFTRGYFFSATMPMIITGVRVPPNVGSTAPQTVYLVRFNSVPLENDPISKFKTLGCWLQAPDTVTISTGNIKVNAGDIIGVFGSRCYNPPIHSNDALNSICDSSVEVVEVFGLPVVLQSLLCSNNSATMPPNYVIHDKSQPIGRVEFFYMAPPTVPDNVASLNIVNVSGDSIDYAEVTSTIYAKYSLSYPSVESNFTATITFNKLDVNVPLVPTTKYVVTISDHKNNGIPLQGRQSIVIPGTLEPGYYTVSTLVNSLDSNLKYADYALPTSMLMLTQTGVPPCLVWPGDVNNDGIVNDSDEVALNAYITAANQRSSWLRGPKRYRVDKSTDPLTYFAWEGQTAIEWNTPEGCYMDADGNGWVNSFDVFAINLNKFRSHKALGSEKEPTPLEFNVSQNYPNPFSSTTVISYSISKPSNIRLTVSDMAGRQVASLIDGRIETGTHEVGLDAGTLASGQYLVCMSVTDIHTGLIFTKSIKITLSR